MATTESMERVLDSMPPVELRKRSGPIDGVRVKTLVKRVDVRGYFIEQLKRGDVDDSGEELLPAQPFAQMSRSLIYARGGNPPEPIKAFHWHKLQWDYWDISQGNARIVLVDLREESATAGRVQTLTAGDHAPRMVAIPPFVAHGYQCLGLRDVTLSYYVTVPYNRDSPDEGRIPWNDRRIGYDWSVENI